MAIAFVSGTTAEAIKLAPIMRALADDDIDYFFWNSAFHVDGLRATLGDLGLPQPTRQLVPAHRQRPVFRSSQVPGWVLRIAAHTLRHRRRLLAELNSDGRPPLLVVHGDTFTTVLGSLIGLVLRVPVAHVEAGMRSGSWRHPFPEELNRKFVARLARYHFAPTQYEVENLRRERARGRVVDTGANTAIDALRIMMTQAEPEVELPAEFGLVTLHRFELLRNAAEFSSTLRTLHEASKSFPLVMPAAEAERARITELGLDDLFGEGFTLLPKQQYAKFLPILARASFVVTDSGGLQQECGFLGMPAAIQRHAVESQHGLGENLLLTKLDPDTLTHFLTHWSDYRRPSQLDEFHPTAVILGVLREEGFLPTQADS